MSTTLVSQIFWNELFMNIALISLGGVWQILHFLILNAGKGYHVHILKLEFVSESTAFLSMYFTFLLELS